MTNGLLTFLPYWAFLRSLRESTDIEPCGKNGGCFYTRYSPFSLSYKNAIGIDVCSWWWKSETPEKQCLPYQPFRHVYIENGVNQDWLKSAGVSPKCDNMTASECTEELIDFETKSTAYHETSSYFYTLSLVGWAITRVLHDILLVEGYKFHTTITISYFSTVFLTLACAASVFVSWNALELLPVIRPHNKQNCACWFRRGFFASVAAIATPVSLTFHMLYKYEDLYRAYAGGDYFITKKYHLARHLLHFRNPMGSVLGVPSLGAPGHDVPRDHLKDARDKTLGFDKVQVVHLSKLCCLGRSRLSWMVMSGIFLAMFSWILALPTIALRAISIIYRIVVPLLPIDWTIKVTKFWRSAFNATIAGHYVRDYFGVVVTVSLILAIIVLILVVVQLFINPYSKWMKKITRLWPTCLPSLAYISDKHIWESADRNDLAECFKRCPEMAEAFALGDSARAKDGFLISERHIDKFGLWETLNKGIYRDTLPAQIALEKEKLARLTERIKKLETMQVAEENVPSSNPLGGPLASDSYQPLLDSSN